MTCACGCRQATRGESRYASDACRARAWRERVGYGPQKPLQSRSNGKQRRSGRQVSYRKAVDWFTAYLIDTEDIGVDEARYNAEQIIGGLLPDRQRAA